jgi:hypothetical protein
MLTYYKETIPGFDFQWLPERKKYAVICPGHAGTWEDGGRHSCGEALSVDATVFIQNAWPKFHCLHAHCDGSTGAKKKTINDFRQWWDPFRLWDIDAWLDEQMEELNQKMAEGRDGR